MSAVGRLTFLYPQLVRGAGMRVGTRSALVGDAGGAGMRRWNGGFAPRHGKGIEPERQDTIPLQPPPPPPAKMSEGQSKMQQKQPMVTIGETYGQDGKAEEERDVKAEAGAETEAKLHESQDQSQPQSQTQSQPQSQDAEENTAEEADTPATSTESEQAEMDRARLLREEAKQSGPLEAVLHMQPPEQVARQHPTMSPPRYVHHFDSYSLVKLLQEGGYSQHQAITIMKGVRMLLAQNLDVAQESLVGKSDVENETYLFRAACSELSTEIKNNRRLQDEHMRQQRSHLQYEVDILTQSLNQELLTVTDNVRGLFNDRKMAVREEQKTVESAVQQVSYKISIDLTSDAKSEIEGVRWVLIRRSVLGIIFMAILTLGTLRYATYVSHERQREAERLARQDEELRKDGGKKDNSSPADAAAILAAN